jgi:hypothetical protein
MNMQRFSKNFSDRLAHYGLAQVAHEHINITSPITIDDNNSPFAIKEITTNCLDELKSLIGTPNNQANAAPSSEHLALSSLATIPDDKIYDAATAYIFGDSSTLQHHKAAIESKLGARTVKVASAGTVTISSVVTFDSSNPYVLTADTLIFEPGGQIVNVGVLTINASTIQNNA